MAAKKAPKRSTKKAAKTTPKRATKKAATKPGRVVWRTPNKPGHTSTRNQEKLDAMEAVLLRVFRDGAALTQAEMWDAARKIAPQEHWPGGDKLEWWAKSAQLNLEAKGALRRDGGRPLRWSLAPARRSPAR